MLRNALRSACAVALLACFMTGAASAQTFDKRTVFTFSGPVALPGVTLPAGQYLFRLADPTGDRKVVAVLSADGKTPYSMFFSLPAERCEIRYAQLGSDAGFIGAAGCARLLWNDGRR